MIAFEIWLLMPQGITGPKWRLGAHHPRGCRHSVNENPSRRPRGLPVRTAYNSVRFDSSNRCDRRTSLCVLSCVKPNRGGGQLRSKGSWVWLPPSLFQGSTDTGPTSPRPMRRFLRTDSFDSSSKPAWRTSFVPDSSTDRGRPTTPTVPPKQVL